MSFCAWICVVWLTGGGAILASIVVTGVHDDELAGQDQSQGGDNVIRGFYSLCADNVKCAFHVRLPNTDQKVPRIVWCALWWSLCLLALQPPGKVCSNHSVARDWGIQWWSRSIGQDMERSNQDLVRNALSMVMVNEYLTQILMCVSVMNMCLVADYRFDQTWYFQTQFFCNV